MKTIGINSDINNHLELEDIFTKSSNIFKKDNYYYIAISFSDVPSEDSNIWINNNDWFRKSLIDINYRNLILMLMQQSSKFVYSLGLTCDYALQFSVSYFNSCSTSCN